MTRSAPSRRIRFFLLWTARLALVAYLVQLSALDHWHTHLDSVTSQESTAFHVDHCHGAGDCSSGGGAAIAASVQPATLPAPATTSVALPLLSDLTPQSAFLTPLSEPPQAA